MNIAYGFAGFYKMIICTVFIVILMAAALVQSKAPDGYIIDKESGHGYRLMYHAQTWDRAKVLCEEDGAKLAVPKSEEEFSFIQKLVRGMHYPSIVGTKYKLLVWLGINNYDDYKFWKNVDGENIDDTEFHTWAGHNGEATSDDPAEPHCVGMDAVNHGLRDFWCDHHQPYICEI